MVIEYEMMHLKRLVVSAICKFGRCSEDAWAMGAEERFLHSVTAEDFNPSDSKIDMDEMAAVREILNRGLWVKMDDNIGRPIIYRIEPR
jgi:hypothetical protein